MNWLETYRGVTALVLGASGFMGQWIARALQAAGADVHATVRDGALARDPHAHVVDLSDRSVVATLVQDVMPAVTFNAAGYGVDPDERAEADRSLAERLNSELPPQLLETLLGVPSDWPGPRLVHLGSVLELGPVRPPADEHSVTRPLGLYAETKHRGTELVRRASLANGVPAVVVRLAQVYGPGEHAGRLLPSLIEAARTGILAPLSIGTQRKDFTYVEDVVEGLLRVGRATATHGDVMNLATGRLTTVREFALEAARLLRLDRELLRFERPIPSGEIDQGPIPIDRLRAAIGWVPPTRIREGIQRTLAHEGLA